LTDVEGTRGVCKIDINSTQSQDFCKIVFPYVNPEIKSAPTARELTYNGGEQELITPGEAINGVMKYAVTEIPIIDSENDIYEAEIPRKKEQGTYYVWYKVFSTSGYGATDYDIVTVTIKPADDGTDKKEDEVKSDNPAAEAGVAEVSESVQAPAVTEKIDSKQKNTTISKPKADKKSITLNWKKVTAKGIKGYEIQYSTDKAFSKVTTKKVTIKKVKTTKTKIKKLKPKTKYYVRIRTFSKKNGENVYSKWSKSKSVKVK
jgi:hypothetical protein